MRRAAVALVAALAATLVAAPSAVAKGPVDLEICGAGECRTLRGSGYRGIAYDLLDVFGTFSFAKAPEPTAYYRLELKGRAVTDWLGEQRRLFFVPSHGVVRTGSSWVTPRAGVLRRLRVAVRGLRPWPAPALARVEVNGRSADPAPYAALLETLPVAEPKPELGDRVEIHLFFERPTPWTTGRRPIRYFPTQDIFHRDSDWFRPPRELARRIEADAGLAAPPAPPSPNGSARGTLLAAAVAATLAALAAAAVGLRRARRPRAASA
jgi:hypothetical protein